MWQQARVAVVVPAHNEARLIGRMLRRLPAWIDLVVVVDDASTDGTEHAIREAGDSRVSYVRHSQNRGVGAAISTGYAEALARGADVIVVMAGDDQMDPADLPALLEPACRGAADYVKGNRFLHPRRRDMPLARRLGSKLLAAATRWATGLRVDDSQCGYTAVRSEALRRIAFEELWPRYGYPNDLLALLADAGQTVVEVPVRPVYADERSGLRPWHLLTVLYVIGRRRLRRNARRRVRAGCPGQSGW